MSSKADYAVIYPTTGTLPVGCYTNCAPSRAQLITKKSQKK
jgi:hypothetical protein